MSSQDPASLADEMTEPLGPTVAHRSLPVRSVPRRSRRRHYKLAAVLVAVVIVAISGAGAGVAYTSLKGQATQLQAKLTLQLEAGQADLEAAKTSLKLANSTHDQALITHAAAQFTDAKVQFGLARRTADSSGLLKQVEGLPGVGGAARSRHVAVDGVADMGVAISDAGLELTALDGQLIKPPSGGQEGTVLLNVLEQTSKSMAVVRGDLSTAAKAASTVDVQVLSTSQQTTFLRAKATIAAALVAVDEFQQLVPIITEVLGGNGARTYLIEQVNPAELRPGGGFIGSYSVLRADHGTLKVIKSGDAVDLIGTRAAAGQPGYITPPGPIHEFVPNTSWSFIDSNFFPDFPSNALAGERFAQPYLGSHLDGVIAIDYYTVVQMLELTGPIAVPGYGINLTSTNLVPLIIQYDLAAYTDSHANAIHKAILAAVAGPLLQRIATLPPANWPALLGAFNDLASTRHLQSYFNNETVQKQMVQFGWSGTLNVTGANEYLLESEANLGGTKANYFVVRHFTIALTRVGNVLHHKVTIDLTDNMPFMYRPSEYYRAFITLYVSGLATSAGDNLRKPAYADPPPPAGTRIIDGWVPLFHGYGHSAQAVFQYDTPWVADGRGEDRIYWQKEPGTLADGVTITWNDGFGHNYTATGDLA